MSKRSSIGVDKENEEEAAPPEPETCNGKFLFPGGGMYEGEYIVMDGAVVRHGKGKNVDDKEIFIGEWHYDVMHGEGEISFGSNATYNGSFVGNKFNGFGTYTWPDGAVYEGYWRDNKMHGRGCYTDDKKSRWEGQFFNGMFDNSRSMIALR